MPYLYKSHCGGYVERSTYWGKEVYCEMCRDYDVLLGEYETEEEREELIKGWEKRMMNKYIKKPVIIEAFQYNGDLKGSDGQYYIPNWAIDAFEEGIITYDSTDAEPCELFIDTLEGCMHVSVGDYIIKGLKGELYPCKEDIFLESYEVCHDE